MGRLVITRDPGASFDLTFADGTKATVTIVDVNSVGQVRIQIQAPSSVEILRDNAKTKARVR